MIKILVIIVFSEKITIIISERLRERPNTNTNNELREVSMYTIISATIKLDLNEFNFDFDSGYIDGSDQWLTPNEESYIGACTTIHEALDIVGRTYTVYVHLDKKRMNLILEYMYISGDDGCIKLHKFADFEGKTYEIDNDLYCPELAQILKDRIYEIKKEQE